MVITVFGLDGGTRVPLDHPETGLGHPGTKDWTAQALFPSPISRSFSLLWNGGHCAPLLNSWKPNPVMQIQLDLSPRPRLKQMILQSSTPL